ncbi:p-hydroxybenzoic acid efflux pump subunit AaeB [Pectobacterium cacticida]|uniref:p-hydroxybenzoic acid efflux pump subunit AaeB n=2 Tax=Pectobacterium cacticida TaxID=69221 RepID=A0ABZ2GBG7_9GAMM|nr:p-hydroxybenzoic acid efflux pump subunit AaeB [Pectobacterium cacticida]UYX07076.1 p-hydroxybenzoic acid efflux pump subunit AaeB [Pectobacterium cacticida]
MKKMPLISATLFTTPTFARLRFSFKLSFAIVLSLFLGFHLQLETPRWSVLTAAIVAAGPAFAAGGEPFSGAIRHRGILRIIGTFIGCIGALIIIIATVSAPVVMLMLCCIWAGFCTWISSLVKVENAYVFGLAGYTALIIIVSTEGMPLLTPQFAVERCSEIVLGIVCAILADLLFSPRSIKQNVDRSISELLVEQYRLLQLSINGADKESIDAAWHALVRKTTALNGMRSNLMLESSRWQNSNRRLISLHTQSLTMITQACEAYLILRDEPTPIKSSLKLILDRPVESLRDVHCRLKALRQLIAADSRDVPPMLIGWIGAATRYQLLAKGVQTNGRITSIEADILNSDVKMKAPSAETRHAMINGLRTGVATALGCLFWLSTGWTSGSVCMVMIAVVTSLAMRLPNPQMVAKDFLFGTIFALPLGALIFMFIMPSTQQSMLLLCLSLGGMAFFLGLEVQKRRLGSLGALASTINILVLDNPMTFNISQFLDNAIGQIIGSFLALIVILLIRDNTKAHTGRVLLNRFVYGAVSALTTNTTRRKENHLPALYQQLFLLLNRFPNDIAKYRLALWLIIMHQRLRTLDIPPNAALSAFHRQLRATAEQVISARRDASRHRHFMRLLEELERYQQMLKEQQLPSQMTEPVRRLTGILHDYQHALDH